MSDKFSEYPQYEKESSADEYMNVSRCFQFRKGIMTTLKKYGCSTIDEVYQRGRDDAFREMEENRKALHSQDIRMDYYNNN